MKGSVDVGSGIADPGFGEVVVRRRLRGAIKGLSGGVCVVLLAGSIAIAVAREAFTESPGGLRLIM